MIKQQIQHTLYKNFLRPILFSVEPETIHNIMGVVGENLASNSLGRKITNSLFNYENALLNQEIAGIKFKNPLGLSAGFDYDGYMAGIFSKVGFGFNTVGTVTALPYDGNKTPRLVRLPKSRALLVNKGFKSEGVEKVSSRLSTMHLQDSTVGVSVGSSNIPQINTIEAAIADYARTFQVLAGLDSIKYFELNISCPNTCFPETFVEKKNFENLVKVVSRIKMSQPIFVKMPSEESFDVCSHIIESSLENGINVFIFSNLAKNREKAPLNALDKEKIRLLKGNLSGKPVYDLSNNLLKQAFRKYGSQARFIGCGGVFSAEDAYYKIRCGASLVQLITGMIYEGPQLIGEINYGLTQYLKRDGYSNISEAIGTAI